MVIGMACLLGGLYTAPSGASGTVRALIATTSRPGDLGIVVANLGIVPSVGTVLWVFTGLLLAVLLWKVGIALLRSVTRSPSRTPATRGNAQGERPLPV